MAVIGSSIFRPLGIARLVQQFRPNGVVALLQSAVSNVEEELGMGGLEKKLFSCFLFFGPCQERRRYIMKPRSVMLLSAVLRVPFLSSFTSAMAPLSYTLAISSVALLLPRDGVEAFVQPRANLLGSGKSYAIMSRTVMSASVERRAFVSQLVSGGLVGALALGSTTERATAYEVRQKYV